MPLYESPGQSDRRKRDLHYDDRTPPSRPAAPFTPQTGRWFGKTTGELTHGGSVGVTILTHEGTTPGGLADWQEAGVQVTAWDFFLNSTDTIPSGTKVLIEWYLTVWVIAQAYCEADDSATAGAAPTQQATYSPAAVSFGPLKRRHQQIS